MNIHENPVRAVRESLGLTQNEMAKRLKTSIMTVRRCEYEKRTPGTVGAREAFQRLKEEAQNKQEQETTTQ